MIYMAISFFGFSFTSLDISLNAFGTNQSIQRHNTERYSENEKFFGTYIYIYHYIPQIPLIMRAKTRFIRWQANKKKIHTSVDSRIYSSV